MSARPADEMIGRTIGHYQILSVIGEGGFGTVYRGRNTMLRKHVALKRLPRDTVQRLERDRELHREVDALVKLDHEAVVIVHDFERSDDADFIVMEYVPGETLEEKLKPGHPLDEREAIDLGKQLATGLAAVHAAGIIHRDLKPDNLRIKPNGRLKILDFGLAKRLLYGGSGDAPDATASSYLEGTLAYIAPEILMGQPSSPSSDLWAVGVILYRMVTGSYPLEELGRGGSAVIHHVPPSPRSRNPRISEELEVVIMRCLERDPARRIASADELATALQALEPAPHRGSLDRILRLSRRRAVRLGLAVLALATIIALVVPRPEPPGIRSLAVLPFKNLTGDPAQKYLADGMTDELITKLGEQESLRVISGWSSSRIDTSLSIPEIGRRLNVQGVVEGSVTISGDRPNFSARLIVARDDRRVWSDDHVARKSDMLRVAGRFARSILKKIGLRPGSARAEPVDPVAYQLYQLGRLQWNRRTEDGVRASIEYFRRAIGRDSLYAEAYSGLADAWTTAGHMGLDPPIEAYARAKQAALQALALDSTLSEGYVSLGNLRQNFDWDWAGAERDFQRAIEINDNNVVAHHWYSNLLAYRGDFDRAREEIQRAQELDPLSTSINVGAGACEYLARRYDPALQALQHVVDVDSSSDLPYRVMAGTYYQLGRRAETANAIGRWIAIKYPPLSAVAAKGYRRSGLPGMARVLLDVMAREKGSGRYVPATHLAELSIVAGDPEAALRWLEVGLGEHDTELNRLKVDPIFDPLRGSPRFAELLRKVHLDT